MIATSHPTVSNLATFHDAELYKVVMDRKLKTLALAFELADGNKEEFSFEGVLTYKIDNIFYQNVVSRLYLTSARMIEEGELDRILSWTFSRVAEPATKDSDYFQKAKSDILAGKLILFYLDPSVGAQASVIAENILIS